MSIKEAIQLGDPVEHRGIVIAPLFPRRSPSAQYLTLDEAIPLGFRITELGEHGSVPELLATNPLDANVLLYDGEEVVGAKQNRILNVTVLVPARSETKIPVSCVEEGRWSARSSSFAPAAHAAYPELRRQKAERLSPAPMTLGLAQAAVWEDVRGKSVRLAAHAPTGAQADIFRSRDDELGLLRTVFPAVAGQSGALVALGPDRLCLDYVSRPDAFARLYPKLLDGYLLDALERLDGKQAAAPSLESFLGEVAAAPRARHASPALGEDVRMRGDRIVGSGLELDGELVQLCAFSSETGETTTIARPSGRGGAPMPPPRPPRAP
jgi:hypothetical protein